MPFSLASRQTGGAGRRVLIVERSRTLRTLLSIYLRNAGHQVQVCSTPQEALRLLANLREPPECIVLAVHAPEQDDYQFIHAMQVQAAYTSMSLVALVLQEDMAQVQRRLKEVRVSYLSKPFRVQDALALVAACREQ